MQYMYQYLILIDDTEMMSPMKTSPYRITSLESKNPSITHVFSYTDGFP